MTLAPDILVARPPNSTLLAFETGSTGHRPPEIIVGIVAAGLMLYLLLAMFRPEKF
jgi:K+-transporting ATPase KdpF subunit